MIMTARKGPRDFESLKALIGYIDQVIRSVDVDFGRKEQGRPMPPTSSGAEEALDEVTEMRRQRARKVPLSDEVLEVAGGT